jgi:ABC-type branched-subunit amino acid transport system ATPase component
VRFGEIRAVDNVDFSVATGEIVGLIGPNGAGKSTFVNAIAGVIKVTTGRVIFDGRDLRGLPPYQRARLGLVRTFQNLELFGSMTVLENLLTRVHARASLLPTLGAIRLRRVDEDRARSILSSFGLEAQAARAVSELSYADRKLVEVARAFAADLRLVLLDEPVAGVAVEERRRVVDVIGQQLAATGVSAIVIEHDMDVVKRLCHRVVVIDSGRILASGVFEEVSKDPRVREAYLG